MGDLKVKDKRSVRRPALSRINLKIFGRWLLNALAFFNFLKLQGVLIMFSNGSLNVSAMKSFSESHK